MKKQGFIIGATILVALMSLSFLVSTGTATTTTLLISGSTTLQPVITDIGTAYDNYTNGNTTVTVTGGGSGTGIANIETGTVNIGMSSRPLASADWAIDPLLNETAVALDGLSVVVNTANPVSNLTFTQLDAIYNGTFTNWDQVGGQNLTITVIGRTSASGTRSFFQSTVMINATGGQDNYAATMQQDISSGAVQDDVIATPGAIGYIGLGFTNETKILGVMNSTDTTYILPSISTVSDFNYPISRYLYLITQGTYTNASAIGQFISYVESPAGQAIVLTDGFINLFPAGIAPTQSGVIDGFSISFLLIALGITTIIIAKRKSRAH